MAHFAPAGAALIEQQEQRLKAEAAAREEQRKRAEKRERPQSFGAKRMNAKRGKRSSLRSVAARKRREIARRPVGLPNNNERRLLPKQRNSARHMRSYKPQERQ